MKKISIGFIMFLCLFVLTIGQGMAEDTPTPLTDTPAVTADTPGAVTPDEAAAEPAESEGEISYTADDTTLAPTADADIAVVEARICEGINDREPMAPGDVFPSDINSLFCFSRISSTERTEIKHIWYCNGQAVAEIPLNVGASSGWRTFSSKNIGQADKGNWKVDIVTAQGTPIRTIQFIIN